MWMIDDMIEDVVDAMKAKGRGPRYVKDFTQQMRDHVEPAIGNKLVRDVTATDVDRVLARIAHKHALHSRVRAGLSSVFNTALRGRYRPDNPVLGSKVQQRWCMDPELSGSRSLRNVTIP